MKRPRLVTEAEVARLHERLEHARVAFRPSEGFLLDRFIERLPANRRRAYSRPPGKSTDNKA